MSDVWPIAAFCIAAVICMTIIVYAIVISVAMGGRDGD